jgi:hypothetical protein
VSVDLDGLGSEGHCGQESRQTQYHDHSIANWSFMLLGETRSHNGAWPAGWVCEFLPMPASPVRAFEGGFDERIFAT